MPMQELTVKWGKEEIVLLTESIPGVGAVIDIADFLAGLHNKHKLLQAIIRTERQDLIRELVISGFNINESCPETLLTPLEYALSVNENYTMARVLIALGAVVTPSVFEKHSQATIGKCTILLPQKSAVTDKPLSLQALISILLAPDSEQKYTMPKIMIGFAPGVPVKIRQHFQNATAEFARHANMVIEYTDELALAQIHVQVGEKGYYGLGIMAGHTDFLPPTTSALAINDASDFDHCTITIKDESSITHELAHALLGALHPHDLLAMSYPLGLLPFIRSSSNYLDCPDLTVMSYESIGTQLKLPEPPPREEDIQRALATKKRYEENGATYFSSLLEKLHLYPRAEYHLGYADTVIAIEKYGQNTKYQGEIVIHALRQEMRVGYTLCNQGGKGILDARMISEPAEFVMDAGFSPTKVKGTIYFNGYLSAMQGIVTGMGAATIRLGHSDCWVEIQGAPKTLIMDASQETDYTCNIIGFRKNIDKCVLPSDELQIYEELKPKPVNMAEALDRHPQVLKQLFAQDASCAPMGVTLRIESPLMKGKLILFQFGVKDFSRTDFVFCSEVHPPCVEEVPRELAPALGRATG